MLQTRTFVLTTEPRLKYYKNDVEFRGEIPLTLDVRAQLTGSGMFTLSGSRKVFNLRGLQQGDAELWVEAINTAVL